MNKEMSAIHHQLHKELVALRHCLKIAQEHGARGLYENNRTEALNHFVHCAKEFMNFLSKYLATTKFLATDSMSEKEIIRHCYLNGLITQDEQRLLNAMIDDQYKAAQHTLSKKESTDNKIMIRLHDYFELMAPVTEKIARELGISEVGVPQFEMI
jgi:hypothetical protein